MNRSETCQYTWGASNRVHVCILLKEHKQDHICECLVTTLEKERT